MYIRVKADGLEDKSKKECIITLSKTTSIEELRKLIEEEVNVKPEVQRLFYRGKELVDGHILNDYSVLPNDVIILIKRLFVEPVKDEIKSDEATDKSQDKESAENTPDTESVNLVDAESKYYKVGDLVDVRLLDSGGWFEGIVEKILKKEDDEGEVEDGKLVFRIKSAEHASVIAFEEDAQFENVRPRSYYTFKIPELEPGMTVLANFNIDTPKERGYWYDFRIVKVGSLDIIGTIFFGDQRVDDCNIKFIQECMRIETPTLLTEQSKKPRTHKQRKYPYHCKKCKDDPNKQCRECGCNECAGKQNWDRIILCDECELGFHIECLNPPLKNIPDDDWYCPSCKTDDSQIVKAGEKLKVSKKKQNMPSHTSKTKKDWGRGMACVGFTKTNDKVSKSHLGPIPGVEVGFCWRYRIGAAEAGVHRPPVAGIHGKETDCAYSVVLSGGYEDDIDWGDEFLYTGAGGRDLSGNKRTSNQSCDQTLTRTNKALALNCNAKFDDQKGAEAKDWKNGKPVRVIRSSRLAKYSKYAPEEGFRYDGIYKVVKYYPEKGKSGFIVWRYLFRRDDPAPAPWEKNAKQYDMIYPDGWLEAKQKKEEMESTSKQGQKRKSSTSLIEMFDKKKKKASNFELDEDTLKAIKVDTVNEKLWNECLSFVEQGKKAFLDKVEQEFCCCICVQLIYDPLTFKCGHSMCKACFQRSVKHCSTDIVQCPHCRTDVAEKEKLGEEFENAKLQAALNLLFPGYGSR